MVEIEGPVRTVVQENERLTEQLDEQRSRADSESQRMTEQLDEQRSRADSESQRMTEQLDLALRPPPARAGWAPIPAGAWWWRVAGALLVLLAVAGWVVALNLLHSSSSRPESSPAWPTVLPVAIPAPPVVLLSGLPGNYTFDGGSAADQRTVSAALQASGFDWFLIPQQVVVHIRNYPASASPGNIWLSHQLLASGVFSWGVVDHEYAHEVDFALLTDDDRAVLNAVLGASAWCYGSIGPLNEEGLKHGQYGCERFASVLAWAYWPYPHNSMKPMINGDESSAMDAARFRRLLRVLINAPDRTGSSSL